MKCLQEERELHSIPAQPPSVQAAGQGPTSHPRAQEFHPNQLCNAFQVLLVSEVTDLAALFSLVEKEQGGQLKQW